MHRLGPRADRLRQIAVNFGVRPYNVTLIWGKWNGKQRGEGHFTVVKQIPLLPNPKVEDLSAIALDPRSAGILSVGSIRLSGISPTYTSDMLKGLWLPTQPSDRLAEDIEFFYEVVEDGRGYTAAGAGAGSSGAGIDGGPVTDECAPTCACGTCDPNALDPLCAAVAADPSVLPDPGAVPMRGRFRPASEPMRRAEKVDWTIILERVDENRDRDGREQIGPNRGLR